MIDSFPRRAGAPVSAAPDPAAPDRAFAARSDLARLRDGLVRAARERPSRWGEPAAFFFDAKRQAELVAARSPRPEPHVELTAHIRDRMPDLIESVEVRRVARATAGLRAAADALAPRLPAARDLSELLAVPDDEVFLAVAPEGRVGVRLHVRGAARVADLHSLLAPVFGYEPLQLFRPAAVQPDGTLPAGVAGCGHWLWPTQPLAAVPRVGGERVVIVGPAAVTSAPDAEPRFPGLVVECELVQTLSVGQVAAALERLCGVRPAVAVARAA
jgi:hypothetical protein